MARFFARSRRVSIHYIIARGGQLVQMVPEDEIAIHTRGRNRHSVGIELINRGDGIQPFPEKQIARLAKLIAAIRARHAIPLDAVVGHDDVDRSTFRCAGERVRRKQDPGPLFPWKALRLEVLMAGM
ncbi:MAG: N-acetylmuramoyl-L-alanine amidase [Pseudomonadota bacterium]